METQIKNLAWNTFKKTGNINTFMEFMQIQNLEEVNNQVKKENLGEIKYGDYQN